MTPPKKVDSFYSSSAWKKARAIARLNWKRNGQPPCPICNQHITGTPVVDHRTARKKRPDLAFDQANLQVVCHRCNTAKGIREDNATRPATRLDGFPEGSDWGD